MTFDEFLESDALFQAVGSKKYGKYQKKFGRLIDRANIGGRNIDELDEESFLKDVRWTLGWNWPASFFNIGWYGYRGGHRWMEVCLAIALLNSAVLYSLALGALPIVAFFVFAVTLWLGFGMFADSHFLVSVVQTHRKDLKTEHSGRWFNVFLTFVISYAVSLGMQFVILPMLGIDLMQQVMAL